MLFLLLFFFFLPPRAKTIKLGTNLRSLSRDFLSHLSKVGGCLEKGARKRKL